MNANSISTERKKSVLRKMISARSHIIRKYPFYGYLVMHLSLGVAECGTACTDMKHILFDPGFAEQLTEDQMIFVMLHEVLHCALDHCVRGRNYHQLFYNLAADIVVNSNILYSMGIREYEVNDLPVMHTTPDGQEGYLFSVEEVYNMLLKKGRPLVSLLDSHDIWSSVEATGAESDKWKAITVEAGRKYSTTEMPPVVRDYVMELEREARVDWHAVLHDFIQLYHDRYDFSFSPSDRRFSGSDFIIPAFSEQDEEKPGNLWFCVDSSGSISSELLSEVLSEIRQAILIFGRLSGKLSFFDTQVTEPIPFETAEDLLEIPATGGGGTSFANIFRYLKTFPEEEMPSAVIVLTDGHCAYPPEKAAMDIPVLWIIYDDQAEPPWGRSVHIALH